MHGEVARLQMADGPGFVDEDAGRDDGVAERCTELVLGVDERGVGRSCRFEPWPRGAGAFRVGGDGEKGGLRMLLVPLLPPGQLFAAASPGRPDEQDIAAALIAAELDPVPVEVGEGDFGERSP